MTAATARGAFPLPDAVDGRAARGARTSEAVVDALLALIEAGDLRPAAQRIAEKAGVSLRSVFHHFADLETLYATAAERQLRRFSVPAAPPPDGPLALRIGAFVESRSALLEAISPTRRAALLNEPFSPVLAARLKWARDLARDDVARVFQGELAGRKPQERREVLAALTATAEWSTWEALRVHQGLSVPQGRRVVARTMLALLSQQQGVGAKR